MFVKRFYILALVILLALGFLVRLYRFNNPIADWHSWRQADTAAVTWNFVRTKFDILHPIYFDISNVQSGKDNPHGYRYVEFPLYNAVVAGLYIVFHGLTIEGWGRAVTIFSSIAGSVILFLFMRRRTTETIAWITLICSLFLPFNIYYGRTILPDVSMVTTLLASLYYLDKWLDGFREEKNRPKIVLLILAAVFLAMSLLLKLYTVFYLPAFFILIYSVLQNKMFKRKDLWIFSLLSLVPITWWRIFILSYPEGIPANDWLFNGNGIRFRPAFFRWIFYERLTKLISGYLNAIFIALGVVGMRKLQKDMLFFLSFVGCALLYICVIATGNVQHDYYQIVIMPVVAMLIGFGASWIIERIALSSKRWIGYVLVGIVLVGGFWLSWLQVRDYFNINNIAIVNAGKAIRAMTPSNAKIVAPYGGDTTLLYYTKRKGWPSFEHDLSKLIHMGADYLVFVNPQPNDYLVAKQYVLISSSKDYLLFDLHKKP